MDGNGNIKYPIDDRLLRKMPLLHDIETLPQRPKLHKVFLENSQEFEDLMQIWEFAANCLELPKGFKVEELYAGLKYQEDEEEVTLVSDIVCAILEMAIQEIPDEEREDDDPLLWMIKQLSEDKLKFVWPCMINIFIQGGIFENVATQEIKDIAERLQSATPQTFNKVLDYYEKVKILLFLCNSCHDLNAFREYISARLKEKSKHSREKQETYTEIRKLEQEKRGLVQLHADSDFVKNEGVNNEIVVLEEELKNATRTQGKLIREKLDSLTKEKDNFKRTIHDVEEKIENLNSKIQRLNDSIWKVSLKVSIIGRDLENEYWFFKDDPTKLYVKDLSTNEWGYYNDEETILELENSLITKGTKERRLYEGLRKLKGKMKIRKNKEVQQDDASDMDEDGEPIKIKNVDIKMEVEKPKKEEEKTKSAIQTQEHPDMEVDSDPRYEPHREEIDWDKQLQKAIQFLMKKSEISTRKSNRMGSNKLDSLSLESIKEKLLDLEEEYTETAKPLNKSWAPFSVINNCRAMIQESQSEEEMCEILLTLEEGFSNPMSFKPSDGVNSTKAMDMDGESQSNTSNKDSVTNKRIFEDGLMFYRNNRKIKKFWSSDRLKDSWKDYIISIQNGSISALFLSMCIFIDQTEEYIEKLSSKLEKKKQSDEKTTSKPSTNKKSAKAIERTERKRKAGFYKEESSESDSDDESSKPKRSKRQKTQNESEFDEESDEESDGEFDDEAEDDEEDWDNNCYICNKPGEVICCETCSRVAHIKCLLLRVVPESDWYCHECREKLQNKRQTRSSRKRK